MATNLILGSLEVKSAFFCNFRKNSRTGTKCLLQGDFEGKLDSIRANNGRPTLVFLYHTSLIRSSRDES